MSKIMQKARRGDTFIEVMFAFAVFSLVAIVTLGTMNMGLSISENSLELTVARNELNAQAEALRFIHSSYISELTLPECEPGDSITTKCQQFKGLWDTLINNAIASSTSIAAPKRLTIEYPLLNCSTAYDYNLANNLNSLKSQNAFIINTRQLLARGELHDNLAISYNTDNDAIIYVNDSEDTFAPAQLNARIIYSAETSSNYEDNNSNNSSSGIQSIPNLTNFTRVARAEGIWVIAVRDSSNITNTEPKYYDFYIQTCWNGSNSNTPTSLDTIVRLYNPKGVNQ